MKALVSFSPSMQSEMMSIIEIDFIDTSIDDKNATLDENKTIQQLKFRPLPLPNGEDLEFKANHIDEKFTVIVRQKNEFLVRLTGEGAGLLDFRTRDGATVHMNLISFAA